MRGYPAAAIAALALAGVFAAPRTATVPSSASTSAFVAISPAERGLYHIDLGLYFPSTQAESLDRQRLLTDLAAFPMAAPGDPAAFESWLHRAGTLRAQLVRHDRYLQLRSAMSIDDHASSDAEDALGDAGGRFMDGFNAALRKLGRAGFARMVSARPSLEHDAFVLEQAERAASHDLPPEQEKLVDALADPALSGWWKLYQDALRGTSFAQVRASDGRERDARKDAKALMLDPDRNVRETAWRGLLEGFASRGDSYADILFGIVRMHDSTAKLRHYADAPSEVYFRQFLTRKEVDDTLAAVQAQTGVFKRYQRLRDAHIAAVHHIRDVHSWDVSVPDPGAAEPRFTLDQTRASALAALAPLGDNYVVQFRALLDSANHRMDVAADEERRVDDNFSVGGPGMTSALFVQNYKGYLRDADTIIHEGGHAIHQQLMSDAGVSPFYQGGPSWMFEAYAILNEMLLYDHLYRTSADPRLKAYYLNALINDMTFQIFTSAEEGTLEQSIYDGVAAGKIGSASDLDALTLATLDRFEIARPGEPLRAHLWATKRLMYEDSLYLINYLYAGLVATRLFEMAQRDPADFRKRYMALLSHGFYAPPQQLLATFFGHPVSWPQLVDADMKAIDAHADELRGLYAHEPASH